MKCSVLVNSQRKRKKERSRKWVVQSKRETIEKEKDNGIRRHAAKKRQSDRVTDGERENV